jgi:hypothetical protein
VLHIFRDPSPEVLALNLSILDELARQAREIQCRVVLVDTSRFFNAATHLPQALADFCRARHIAYVPLADDLLAAEASGLEVQFRVDTHFNDLENRIAADALYRSALSIGSDEGAGR